MASESIKIPLSEQEGAFVEIFPDELPTDFNVVADLLQADCAPLQVWRQTAVQYYRQGFIAEFEFILNDILEDGMTRKCLLVSLCVFMCRDLSYVI